MIVTRDLELALSLALVSYPAFGMQARTGARRSSPVLLPPRVQSAAGDPRQWYGKGDAGSQGK